MYSEVTDTQYQKKINAYIHCNSNNARLYFIIMRDIACYDKQLNVKAFHSSLQKKIGI